MSRELDIAGIRRIQLEILGAFDRHCSLSGLRYTLAYGTLLGAVRHAGYIPWDDDIDVMMPRADYDRLVESASIDRFEVRSLRHDRSWPLPYAKVCDTGTQVVEPTRSRVSYGVNIDVFPVDPVPQRRAFRAAHLAVCRVLACLHVLQTAVHRPGRCRFKSTTLRVAGPLLDRLPASSMAALRTWHARQTPPRSGLAGVVVGSFPWQVPQDWLLDTHHGCFEGREWPLPANSDGVLTALYGDYRVLPPSDRQVSHHAIRAYVRTEVTAR